MRTRLYYRLSGLLLLATLALPWKSLFTLALSDDQYTHILFVPFIAGALIYLERGRIFRDAASGCKTGVPIIVAGILLRNVITIAPPLSGSCYDLPLAVSGGIVIVTGAFLACFGGASRRSAFALGFLLLMIPVPKPLMRPVIAWLQDGSAIASAILFRLIHLPAFRQGLTFSLPGFDIEIAEQCSGIRSSIALCIASMIAGHLLLRRWWRKTLLVLLTIPVAIFKNALRIVTIASLGAYVSQSFLHGALHRYSGLPFSLVEVAIMAPLVERWRRLDVRSPRESKSGDFRACIADLK